MKTEHLNFVLWTAVICLCCSWPVLADESLRQCENEDCRQYALSARWEYCPFCGTKLPAVLPSRPEEDVILGNIFKSGEFGFQIELPNENWKFLQGEDLTEGLNEDATIGLVSDDGVYSMIIVEKMPNVSAEQYLQLVAPTLEGRQLVEKRTAKVDGAEGVHAKWSGSVNDLPFHFYQLIIAYGPTRLQLVSWVLTSNDSQEHQLEIGAIEDSLALLPSP